jgi:hypothetical protein
MDPAGRHYLAKPQMDRKSKISLILPGSKKLLVKVIKILTRHHRSAGTFITSMS